MAEPDTIRLLRECDAGVKMGTSSIEEVLDRVQDQNLKACLNRCREEHQALDREIQTLLDRRHDEGKDPSPLAKGMSWMKTNWKLGMDESDQTIANLITDGCNMGTKTLNRYLNQYPAADETAKAIAQRLIRLEEGLTEDIRQYL